MNQSPRSSYRTLIAIVIVIGSSVGALYYFSTAHVEVTPNTVSAAVQASLTATKSTGDLPYEIITAQKVMTQSVKSSGTKAVSSSASGLITIYNTQAKAQKLITNTRFATTAGLIFRIHSAVTVLAGSTAKPGSIAVKVYADKAGDAYNVGPTSFTIPGFAGTPQASEVYARSSSAMTGGASGNIPVVDAALESQTRAALRASLATDLSASLESQVPSGYVLVPGAATTTYTQLAPAPSTTADMADVTEQGTITAVVFPDAALAKAAAASVTGLGYQDEPVSFTSTDGLKVIMSELPPQDISSFSFMLAGTASLTYTVDSTRIAAAVAGKTRAEAQTALANYPEVKRAIIVLRPFWRQTFPQDPSSISITVNTP